MGYRLIAVEKVSIPYSRNPEFVGRDKHLTALKSRSSSIGKVHSRMAIYGLGGVGLVTWFSSRKTSTDQY